LVDLVGDIEIRYLPEPPEGMEITSVELVVRVSRKRQTEPVASSAIDAASDDRSI
jgi:hypothetical protein